MAEETKDTEINYIGISENRLHHILGVARKAYSIAKEMGYDENFARRMFMIGWNHDVGYEFSEKSDDHAEIGAEMLIQLMGSFDESYHAIEKHGCYTDNETIEWKIINMADMLVDSRGNNVTVSQRLDDIKERYGESSEVYKTACGICYQVGLIAVNPESYFS